MKIKNIICLVLSLILCVTVLSACGTSNSSAAVSLPSTADEEGRFIYSVIRGDASSDVIGDAAKNLRTAIKENYGYKVTMAKDSVVEAANSPYEVLIGNTNRPESQQALKVLTDSRSNNSYDFIIKVINNKICIQATTDEMVSTATDWFINTFCQKVEDWSLLKTDYEFLYQPDVKTVDCFVAGQNLGFFTVVKPLDMSYIIGMEVEELIKYFSLNGLNMDYIEEIDEECEYELLIGNTSREESKSVAVEGENYVIKVIGKKLVVKGGSDLATYRAVKYLVDSVKESSKQPINWTDGYVVNGKYDETEENIYTLNFVDEFEGSRVNTDVWGDYNSANYRTGSSCLGGKTYKVTPTNESNAYTTDTGKDVPRKMVYQADGALVLSTLRDGNDFLGTYASTYLSMLFRYGLWEVRAKFPGNPACVGYWMNGAGEQNLTSRYGDLGKSCFTEIDLVENFGSSSWFASNIHRWWLEYSTDGQTQRQTHNSMDGVARYNTKGNNKSYGFDQERYGEDLTKNYHTYTFYWDENCMKFAFDGKTFVTYDYKDEMSVAVHSLMNYTILSCGMGDSSYGATYKREEHLDYYESYIDSVKVYQTAAINSQMVTAGSEYAKDLPTVIKYPDVPLKGSY